MSRRNILIISLVILTIIIIVIAWFLMRPEPQELPPVTIPLDDSLTIVGGNDVSGLPPASVEILQEEQKYSLGLKQLAFFFTEHFGSYSNQADFSRLNNLKSVSTDNMANFIDQIIIKGTTDTTTYEGVETKALASKIIDLNNTAGTATLELNTQRTSFIEGNDDNNVYYQKIELRFIRSGDEWKVDFARWLE